MQYLLPPTRNPKLEKQSRDEAMRREIARLAAVIYRFNEYSQTSIDVAVHVAQMIIKEAESIPSEKL